MKKVQTADYINWLIILAVCIIRIAVYFCDRSLIIDEANLARNIIEKNYLAFFSSLDYEQYAPPLFLCLEKMFVELFGVSSMSLRFIPFLSSILSILLFYKIITKYIPSNFRFFPILIFSIGLLFSRYGTELKQYSTDVLIFLAFLYAHLNYPLNFNKRKNTILWMVLGAIFIWASMPVIFILAAIVSTKLLRDRLQFNREWFYYLGITFIYLASFGIYYYRILQQDSSVDLLLEFHQNYFLNILDWKTNFLIIQNLLNKIFGFTIVTQIFIWIGLIFSFKVFKKHLDLFLLFLFLFFYTFLASFLQKFTLIPRVALFLAPFLILLVSIGYKEISQKITEYAIRNNNNIPSLLYSAPIFILMALTIINLPRMLPYNCKVEIENTKSGIEYIQANLSDKKLITDHLVYPSFYFYTQLSDNKMGKELSEIEMRDWNNSILDFINKQIDSEFYFWYSTIDNKRLNTLLEPLQGDYKVASEISFENNHIIKFTKK